MTFLEEGKFIKLYDIAKDDKHYIIEVIHTMFYCFLTSFCAVLLHEPGDNAVVSVKMTNSVCTQIDDYGSISRILIAMQQQSGTFYDKHTTPVGLLNWFDDASKKIVSKHMVHINGDVWHEYVVPSLIREYFR